VRLLRVCCCCDRYKHLQGKCVVHPVSQRRIPIIADAELVDMEFGTGERGGGWHQGLGGVAAGPRGGGSRAYGGTNKCVLGVGG
jgi:hypothetical protein